MANGRGFQIARREINNHRAVFHLGLGGLVDVAFHILERDVDIFGQHLVHRLFHNKRLGLLLDGHVVSPRLLRMCYTIRGGVVYVALSRQCR